MDRRRRTKPLGGGILRQHFHSCQLRMEHDGSLHVLPSNHLLQNRARPAHRPILPLHRKVGFPSLPFLSFSFFFPLIPLPRSSITGGYVYRGSAVSELRGLYVFGDYGSGSLFTLDAALAGSASACSLTPSLLLESSFAISSFGVVGSEIYFADLKSDGGLYTFSPDPLPSPSSFPSPSRSPSGVPSFPSSLSNSLSVPGVATIEVFSSFPFIFLPPPTFYSPFSSPFALPLSGLLLALPYPFPFAHLPSSLAFPCPLCPPPFPYPSSSIFCSSGRLTLIFFRLTQPKPTGQVIFQETQRN